MTISSTSKAAAVMALLLFAFGCYCAMCLSGCAAPVVAVAAPLDFSKLDAKVTRAQRLNETIDQRAVRIQREIRDAKAIIDRK